jgi:hypothetical protein
MPAKSKSKKPVKSYVRKKIRKAPPRATFSQVNKPIMVEEPSVKKESAVPTPQQPQILQPPEITAPPLIPPSPPAKQDPAPRDAQPVPVSQPVENLEQILDTDTKDSAADAKNRVVFTLGIIVALAIIVGAVFVFVIFLGSSKVAKPVTEKVTVTPTVTPTPAFIRANITFEVINASGVSGAATKGASALSQAGYTVLSVGNGKKQATSSVFLAGSLTSIEKLEILADVTNLFSVASSSGDLTDSTASARLILGIK